nr:uncharacterized protein LOC116423910 [Nomia melanderi]XP_031825523.1 uncharacterized protein LOC116423910 [Nomia melanderi]
MSAAFRAVLLASAMLQTAECEFREPERSRNYSVAVPFLEKWVNKAGTGLLTVVFDEHVADDVPRQVLARVSVPARLLTLEHLMSVDPTNSSTGDRTIDPSSCVLLLFSGIDQLSDAVTSSRLASFWQPESSYVLENRGASIPLGEFCRCSERLWNLRGVYKLVGITGDEIVRYDPFGAACRNDSKLANGSDVFDLLGDDRRSFGEYPLRISIFESTTMTKRGNNYGGVDYRYLREITRTMNVTPVLVTERERYGWEEDGVFFGTLGHLVRKQTDASFNQFFVKDYLTQRIQFTAAVTSDKLCVLVPRASLVPDYLVIVNTFSHGAWLLIFAGHFVIAAIYTTLRSRERAHDGVGHDGSSGARVGGSFPKDQRKTAARPHRGYPPHGVPRTETTLGAGSRLKRFKGATFSRLAPLVKYLTKVVLQPSQPFQNYAARFPERLFVMCSLWLSLILNGVFTSQLAASFSKRHYYDDIDTLEQLEKSGLAILTNSRDIIEDALTDDTSPVLKRLHARMMYANDSEIDRRLFRAKDAAYLHRLTTLPSKFDKYHREQLHVVKECPKNYILAYVLTKGSPFRGRVNSILARLNNAGFYGKWYRGTPEWNRQLTTNGVPPAGEESIDHKKITIKHLFIPFAIFHVGLATATVVFICERRRASSDPRDRRSG